MKCLVVIAHPLADSLCTSLAATAIEVLQRGGHTVEVENLYDAAFSPALSPAERASYYTSAYDASALRPQIDHLLAAEALVLAFPTWWFGPPAILKGWFDRVWAPGIAYDHASDLGPIRPRLHGLRRALAITTLGAPWWADRLVMLQPVKRQLKTAILRTCAPNCRLQMLSLYKAERPGEAQVRRFRQRIEIALRKWK